MLQVQLLVVLVSAVRWVWHRAQHKVHWLRHRELHASHCTCQGTGKFR